MGEATIDPTDPQRASRREHGAEDGTRPEWTVLLLVLAACAVQRGWLILHTDVIAKDGTVYVKMAREWTDDPRRVAKTYDYHVGYPAAMAGAYPLLKGWRFCDELHRRELAGQFVSYAASLVAIIAVWLMAGIAFNWRAAWVAALLFGLGHKWAELGADVLSDALSVCLQMWGVVLIVWAHRRLRSGSRWCVVLAAFVGLCAGLGYLVRPEALLIVMLAVALWMFHALRQKQRWVLAAAASAMAAAVTLACVLPYAMVIGGLSRKKSIGDFVLRSAGAPARVLASLDPTVWHAAPRKFINQLFEAMHPLVALLACMWLLGFLLERRLRGKSAALVFPSPRPPCGFLMLAALAVMAPLLMSMYVNVHYLSHRHVMFLAALLAPLAGAGAINLTDGLRKLLAWCRLRKLPETGVRMAVVGVLAVGLALHAMRPLHEGKGYFRQAGRFVAATQRTGDFLITDSAWVLHYSQVPGALSAPEQMEDDGLVPWMLKSGATLAVFSDLQVRKTNPKIPQALTKQGFTEVQCFAPPGADDPDVVRVYRWSGASPPAGDPVVP